MDRKFIYFINPISGTKGKAMVPEIIKKITTEEGIPFEILHTNAEGDYRYLLQKIAAEKITDIIVCGGDGTVNQLANALLGIDINIGIIPMGSGNGLAFTAGIPKRIDKALEIIFTGHAEYIDSFYINDRFSCMLCGLGFDAQVAHDFARQKRRGLATYVKQSTRNFFRAKPYAFKLIADDQKKLSVEAYFITISNSNQHGNHFTIAPKAQLTDGLLDIVVIKKMNKLKLIFSVLKHLKNGKPLQYDEASIQKNDISYFQASKLRIHNPGLAPLHIDGDPADTFPEFKIELIKKAFRLILPA